MRLAASDARPNKPVLPTATNQPDEPPAATDRPAVGQPRSDVVSPTDIGNRTDEWKASVDVDPKPEGPVYDDE